jgi:hypothetical protein
MFKMNCKIIGKTEVCGLRAEESDINEIADRNSPLKVLSDKNQGGSEVVSITGSFLTV